MVDRQPVEEGFWHRVIRIIYGITINTSLSAAITTTTELFNQAKETIWIVAGRLNEDLWASSDVIEAIEAAAKRNVEIRFIFGPKIDPKNKEIPRLHKEGKIYLHKLGERPEAQFIVVDEKHARVEEAHIPSQGRRAWRRYDTIMLARRLELDFKQLLPHTVEVSENEPI